MSHLLVYATTDSRLHADLVIVRLREAGISLSQISIFQPGALRTNSALCWITGSLTFPISSGASVSVAGRLGAALRECGRDARAWFLADRLGEVGLSNRQCGNVEGSLEEGRIVVAIETADEFELPAIYHTLRGLEVEKVHLTRIGAKAGEMGARLRRFRPVLAAGTSALMNCSAA